MEQVKALLEKGVIEYVPHSNRETGFYSRYIIVPKKDWELCPILDLRVLNDSVRQLKFKMLTLRQIVQQIRSEDWFVTIDLKDAYFHISTYPYPHEVPEVCFWGQSIPISGSSVQHSIITPHFHIGSSASKCRAGPQERVGVTAKCQKECAFSTTEDHLPWRGMGLNVDAGVPVTVMYRVHPVGCKKYKARPVTHCQTIGMPSGGTFCPKQGARYFPPHPELWKMWAWPLRGPSS